MGTKFTRRRFLTVVSAGATYLTLTNTVSCDLLERTSKGRSSHDPKASPSRAPKVRPLSSSSSTPAKAFRSRPDLRPPAVEVSTQARETAPGYIFTAPKKGAGQDGPMIIDNLGQPVWFSKGKYALDFKVQYYQGKPVLTWWEGDPFPRPSVGEYVLLDSSYREIARVQAGNGHQGNQHEFLITPQGTALFTVYNPVRRDLSPLGGPKDGLVMEGIIQEVDIETGEVFFEWHSLEHISPDESYRKPKYRRYFDYFHLNSIDVDHDNNLLISARHTSAVYKVNRKSGEIVWRLGGKRSDFEMGPGTRTAFQHDARRQPDGTITIFDNGAVNEVEQSRGIVVELDEDDMTATLRREYTHPDKLLSTSQANMQVLPNGNVFIGWGSEPFFSEFSRDGKLLFNARFPPNNNHSYRTFRFPWKGQPQDAPAAVVAESESDGRVTLYASWNGATEVATWEVLAGPSPSRLEPLGSVPRDGFETAMVVQTSDPYVAVRAKHHLGKALGTTAAVAL
jgi:hypothetical protein